MIAGLASIFGVRSLFLAVWPVGKTSTITRKNVRICTFAAGISEYAVTTTPSDSKGRAFESHRAYQKSGYSVRNNRFLFLLFQRCNRLAAAWEGKGSSRAGEARVLFCKDCTKDGRIIWECLQRDSKTGKVPRTAYKRALQKRSAAPLFSP